MSEAIDRDVAHLNPAMQAALKALQEIRDDFIVCETRRSYNRQLEMLKSGKSKNLHSLHLTGAACDIMPKGGYDKWDAKEWQLLHDEWDATVISQGHVPEKRISWDLAHLGIKE